MYPYSVPVTTAMKRGGPTLSKSTCVSRNFNRLASASGMFFRAKFDLDGGPIAVAELHNCVHFKVVTVPIVINLSTLGAHVNL